MNIMLTAADINSELDELDREEFYRLKKVSNMAISMLFYRALAETLI